MYWWMLPLSGFIAVCANLSGIGGAAVFGPVFIILFPLLGYPPLSPPQAVATAVFVEIFGFSSGVLGYWRRGLMDPTLSSRFFVSALPLAVVSSIWIHMPVLGLKLLYTIVMLVLSVYMLRISQLNRKGDGPLAAAGGSTDALVDAIPSAGPAFTVNPLSIGDADPEASAGSAVDASSPPPPGFRRLRERLSGKVHEYVDLPLSFSSLSIGAFGGFMIGLIGVGLGEVTVPRLMHLNIPVEVASAASVLSVAVTCVVTAAVQLGLLASRGGAGAIPWGLIAWMVPGVVVGAQVATYLQGRLGRRWIMQRAIGVFFGAIGLLFLAVVVQTERAGGK